MTLTVDSNNLGKERIKTLNIKNVSPNNAFTRKKVSIFQAGEPYKTSVSPTIFQFDKHSGRKIMKVVSNIPWQIDSIPNWITLSHEAGSGNKEIYLSVRKNIFTEPLNGHFIVTGKYDTIRVNVSQEAGDKTLDITPSKIYFDGQGGSSSLQIVSSDDWKILSSIPNWLTVNKVFGKRGYDTLRIRAIDSQNIKKNFILTFDNKFLNAQIEIEQIAEK